MAAPARWKLLTALWTVYLVWGSTYLAIKLSVRTLPVFLSAGSRFLLAGVLLALILWLKGRSIRVTRRELASSALLGLALLGLGVGLITLAETRIDSSVAAMIAGSVPLQVILLRTIARERVALATRLSVLVGLAGLALIVIPGGGGSSSAIGLAIAVVATISWSLGSFFAHRLPLPGDGFVATTWEMLSAGVFLLVLGVATGEPWTMDAAGFSFESIAAWLYLGIVGSLIGFTAYAWLLRNAPISQVVTHQYVNPLVAIALGALLLDEQLTLAVGARRGADRRLGLRRRPAGGSRRQGRPGRGPRRSRLGESAVRRAPARAGVLGIALEIVHEAGLGLDPPQPGPDRRVVRQRDAGVLGEVRVGVEADVRDGVVRAEEEVGRRELPLEHVERVPADLLPALDELLVPFGPAGEDPEAACADVRLEQVLLEEEPLRRAGTAELVGGQKRRSLGEVEQDRARLGEMLPGIELEHGSPPGGVAREVLRRLRLAREEIDRYELEVEPELRGEQPHLVAVRRGGEVVELHEPPFTCERWWAR